MPLEVASFHPDGIRQNLCVVEGKAYLSPIANPFRSLGIGPGLWLR
jgi:hypothetical protein